MTSIGKKLRMSKIFAKDGRALILAYDHRAGGRSGPGLVDPGKTIDAIAQGGADAIMTTFGVIRQHHDRMAAGGLGVLVRTDCVGSAYTPEDQKVGAWPEWVSVETAMRIGCDGVINMVIFGSSSELKALEFAAKLSQECEKWGMPWAAETIPGFGGKPLPDNKETVLACCQVSEELGADFVKTHWPGSEEDLKEAISTVKIPILLAGGAPTSSGEEYLMRVESALNAGARGFFCGRNIFTYKDPVKMTKAISMVLHEGASAKEAVKILPE